MSGLDLDLSTEQAILRDAVQRVLADVDCPDWDLLASQLGLAGLCLPEVLGGFAGGPIEVALVMAELGPALAGADWLSHAAASGLLARVAPDHPALADLARGSARAALVAPETALDLPDAAAGGRVAGTVRQVAGGATADIFVVIAGATIAVVSSTDVRRSPRPLHDGSIAADIVFDGARGEMHDDAAAAAAARDLVLAGRCAEATGLMQQMLADTAGYLVERRQFGVPIATFQVLRHRLADMQLVSLQAAALTEQAVTSLAASAPGSAADLAAACVAVRDAVRVVGEGAVQLHGAMGLTEELKLGGRFKRALAIGVGLGSEAGVLARFDAAAA